MDSKTKGRNCFHTNEDPLWYIEKYAENRAFQVFQVSPSLDSFSTAYYGTSTYISTQITQEQDVFMAFVSYRSCKNLGETEGSVVRINWEYGRGRCSAGFTTSSLGKMVWQWTHSLGCLMIRLFRAKSHHSVQAFFLLSLLQLLWIGRRSNNVNFHFTSTVMGAKNFKTLRWSSGKDE